MSARRVAPGALAIVLAATGVVAFADVAGTVFEDRDGDGIHDAGEPGVSGATVRLYGTPDAGGAADLVSSSATDGGWSFDPGNGCYLVLVEDPPGWRMSQSREDGYPDTTPGYVFPVGEPRFAKIDGGIDRLRAGTLRFTAMGDSIAWNFNFCGYPESFWYAKRVRDRLACVAPGATVSLDQAAVKGEHTDDLLVDDTADLNNIFRVLEIQPDLVTISMVGNDALDVDPGANPSQAEIDTAVAELLDSRQNLQEALSVLTSETSADVALNSLYDNEAYNCYSGDSGTFHRQWIPIMSRILRDLAWGQARRVSVIEAAAEFAKEDQATPPACTGFDQMICRDLFQLDLIHPTNNGYTILREKAWEALGGINLGPKDALGRTALAGVDYGMLRRVRRLLPTRWETRGGASVANPEAAFDDADGGSAAAIALGIGAEEFRLGGFPDWYDEIEIVRVLAGVRYRTTGTVADDVYRMEASLTGAFRPPPGHAYTPTDWNYYTPIVGGGGPNRPSENPDYGDAVVLVVPEVPSYREVSATLTKNPVLDAGATDYSWPAVTHEELATTEVRVAAAPVAGTPGDDWQVELDAAWLDLYGWEKARPAEVEALRVRRDFDGSLGVSFDASGADRYNLYGGRLSTVRAGAYDHGAGAPFGPDCAAATADVGGGRLEVTVPAGSVPADDLYFLVTGHVDDVESPSGVDSGSAEIDRSQSVCR